MKKIPLLLLTLVPLAAAAQDAYDPSGADFNVRIKAAAQKEGDRDLGTGATPEGETSGGYLDINPSLHLQLGNYVGSYVRVQGFVPSGDITQSSDERTTQSRSTESDSYGQLRELWFEANNLAGYPGQFFRVGLQRVRQYDGLWWDKDVESVRWVTDTTLLQGQLGAAQQFDTWRTDDVELSPSQEDRTYGFFTLSRQWVPENYIGLRAAYAHDRGDPVPAGTPVAPEPAPGEEPAEPQDGVYDADDKRAFRKFGWLGLHFENGYYLAEQPQLFAYTIEGIALGGTSERVTTDGDPGCDPDCATDPPVAATMTTGTRKEDVRGFGGDAGLRVHFPSEAFPLQIGGAYAYGSGGRKSPSGGDRARDETFEQTGLHSNRSRFTGTRTMTNRFNEALQADLSNLRVATAYLSLPYPSWDFSFIASSFQRDEIGVDVITHGIDADPDPASTSHDLGRGYDVVLTRHFVHRHRSRPSYVWDEEGRSNIRVRGSSFRPGAAYGNNVDNQYLLVLEGTLWW